MNSRNSLRHRLVWLAAITQVWVGGWIFRGEAAPGLPKIQVASDGKSFIDAAGVRYVPMGVTYYRPGTGWAPQVWKKFDASATEKDFARMEKLGVNCVRVFLSFGSFYPTPGKLSEVGLAKFDEFLKIAERHRIYIQPTGPDHWEGLPGWARGDRYADEKILRALETFWRLFARRYRGQPVIFSYDLLNEPAVPWKSEALERRWSRWLHGRYASRQGLSQAWGHSLPASEWRHPSVPGPEPKPMDPELLDYQHFRESVATEWTRRQVRAIKAADPQALVTIGLIQWSVPVLLPGLRHYSAFRPSQQTRFLDFLEIHFYPLAHGFYEYSGKEAEARNLAYLESLVRETAQPKKPLVIGEFGWYGGGKLTINHGKHPFASEEQQARYCRKVIQTTQGLASGWLNWGLYDQPEARDVSQLTGLLTADGKVKAWGKTFHQLAVRFETTGVRRRALGKRPSLDWDRCVTDPEAAARYREAYFRAFEVSSSPTSR